MSSFNLRSHLKCTRMVNLNIYSLWTFVSKVYQNYTFLPQLISLFQNYKWTTVDYIIEYLILLFIFQWPRSWQYLLKEAGRTLWNSLGLVAKPCRSLLYICRLLSPNICTVEKNQQTEIDRISYRFQTLLVLMCFGMSSLKLFYGLY